MIVERFRQFGAIATEFGLYDQNCWVASLRHEKNRLIAFSRHEISTVFSSELYMDKESGFTYARLNRQWDNLSNAVDTVVIGPKAIIQRYANHDHKLIFPYSIEQEYASLAIMNKLSVNDAWYYIRPSSFICTGVELREIVDMKIKFVMLERVIGAGHMREFFSHIHEIHEEDVEHGGFVITNSKMYIENHPELDFVQVVDSNKYDNISKSYFNF